MSLNGLQAQAKWVLLKAGKRISSEVIRRVYRDSNRDIRRSMILAGVARSGTTWLADIVSSSIPCRVMSEPFSPHRVVAYSAFPDFQYRRPDDVAAELYAYALRILQGDIRDRWIDREVSHILPQYRLVKEIRAHLFLRWLHDRFPDVPLLLVIRHPCAVVLSRMEAGWAADADLDAFLGQPALVDDFLADKMDVIANARAIEEKHAIIWCVLHLVPRQQFQSEELPVVSYENLCLQPEKELHTVFRTLGLPYCDSALRQVHKASRTTSRRSAILTGEDRVTRWQSRLSPQQIERVLSVVKSFGLDHVYGEAAIPVSQTLWG
jgi:hypothetical protein